MVQTRSLYRNSMAALCIAALLMLLLFSEDVSLYATQGLELWAYSVLPVLFPSIILSKFWIYYQVPEELIQTSRRLFRRKSLLSETLPLMILGLCSGLPIGAIYVRHFYENGLLPRRAAERLLPLCSFVSPVFLLGYVYRLLGESLWQTTKKQWHIMLFCLYAPLILLYIVMILQEKKANYRCRPSGAHPSVRKCAEGKGSIRQIWLSSLEIIATIGIYIMLFSILFGLSEKLPVSGSVPFLFFLSNLEVTTGSQFIITARIGGHMLSSALLLSALSLGGLCSLAQIGSVVSGSGLSIKPYVRLKLMSALLTVLLCLLLL
ncbi:MAG: hypothetical protein IJI25_03155 [Eubacterium sp.]|nr:hypothetical protein [Eubacterium sp.]